MPVRHAARVPALFLALGLVSIAMPAAGRDLSYNFRVDLDQDRRITSCSDIEMRFGDEGDPEVVTVRRDRTLVVKAPVSGPLRVRPGEHGGVRVQPSEDGGYSALVCMAAGARNSKDADAILDRIRIENADGALSVSGPDGEWAAFVVLSVPREAALDLSATNGSLSLRDVSGRFTLRTTNGPISIDGANGVVDAEAVNGPIKFRGHAGDVRLAAQNGPVKVTLDDPRWSGKGLDASTRNGPVKLEAPETLHAGVEVQGSWYSPVKVNGEKSWGSGRHGGPRWVRLGSGPVLVRVSTVNGPLDISGPVPSKGPVEI
jgi:hypothetical protein